MNRWYLVHTKPKKEVQAEHNLQRQDYEVFLPRIQQLHRRRGRWVDVIEPLFPRYLFIRLNFGHDNIGPVRHTTGVHNLVRFTEEPAVVPDTIIETLRCNADPDTGVFHPQGPLFKPGDKVILDRGPMTSLQAIFLAELGQDRVSILLEILGRENRVTVKRDLLRLA